MKKTLAAILALTMAFGLASCDGSSSTADTGSAAESSVAESSAESSEESSEESSAESSEESSEESAADESSAAESKAEESSEAAPAAAGKFGTIAMTRTLENKLFGITAEYSAPAVDGYTVKPHAQSQMSGTSTDYFDYEPDSDAHHKFGYNIYLHPTDTRTTNYDIGKAKEGKDNSDTKLTLYYQTVNGYDACLRCDAKEDATNGDQWQLSLSVFGGKYLDGVNQLSSSFKINQEEMSKDDAIDFLKALADSVKFTVDEAYVTADGKCKMGVDGLNAPTTISLAGSEYEVEPFMFSAGNQYIRFTPVINEVAYEFVAQSSLTERLWTDETSKEECRVVTIDGKEAHIRLDKDKMSINCFITVKYDDKSFMQFSVKSTGLADGARTTSDGKSSLDLFKEMTGEQYEATVALINGWMDEFVSQLEVTATPVANGAAEKLKEEFKSAEN